MRILQVANNFPPNVIGGAEIVVHTYSQYLKDMGHEVVVFAAEGAGHLRRYNVHKEHWGPVWVWRVGVDGEITSHEKNNFSNLNIDSIFQDCLNDFRPDVVHFHNLPGLSVGMIALAKHAGARTILTAHDHWAYCHRQTLTRPNRTICSDTRECHKCQASYIDTSGKPEPIQKRNEIIRTAFSHLDAIVAPSQYLLERYVAASFPVNRHLVISNGVNHRQFRPSTSRLRRLEQPHTELTFGTASYLGEHKGVLDVVNAASHLPRQASWRLKIAGKGHLESKIQNLIIEEGLSERIELIGHLSHNDMPNFYNQIDVYILASEWPENQPCTILEAQASGVPTIATNIGGSPELLQTQLNQQAGLSVTPKSPTELAHAMLQYFDTTRLREHSLNAYIASFDHRLEKSLHRYLDLYRET